MRLAFSFPALIAAVTVAVVATGCGSQNEQRSVSAATQAPMAAPAATPQPTASPPVPAPTMAPQPQAAPPPPAPPRLGVPQRVEIPSVGVDAEVVGLGLTADGALDAPKDPEQLGWYGDGTRPGERGNALIDGHVDWAGKIRAFWYLKNLRPGDRVIVTGSDGKRHEFAVEWSKWYDAGASVTDLFAQSDQAELTLITCGGQFDKSTRQYLSRLAVRAKLL